eukprot:482414-Alexandrium_andersonii.AAC.1
MHGLCARRAEYSAFVQEAHAIMLRVLKASAGIGVAKAKLEQGQPRVGSIECPTYPAQGEGH